jgi:predicted nucleic acid-binding protein
MGSRALLDTNVLVHAAVRGSPLHEAAARLVDRGLRETGIYCIAPQILVEFAALTTRRRFVDPPLAPGDVERMADRLYRSRRLSKIYPRRATVRRAIREGVALGITGPAWYDCFLALTMRDAGVKEIVTENVADFEGYPFLATRRIEEAL